MVPRWRSSTSSTATTPGSRIMATATAASPAAVTTAGRLNGVVGF